MYVGLLICKHKKYFSDVHGTLLQVPHEKGLYDMMCNQLCHYSHDTSTITINYMHFVCAADRNTCIPICIPTYTTEGIFNPRLRACAARVNRRWSVCVCVRAYVRPSVPSVCPPVFLGNRGNSEHETWTYYQVGGMHGKVRFWSGEGRGNW